MESGAWRVESGERGLEGEEVQSSAGKFFPTSLCGVLVFDSVSRSAFRLPPRHLSTHHLSTHNFVTHHLSHTTCHALSFTHNFVTHHLSHTTLSHTLFHTQLCHTPSFTQNLVTHTRGQATLCHPRLCHPHIHLHFAWQAWPFTTSTFTLLDRRGPGRHPASYCVALTALGWLRWRAWGPLVAR